TWLHKQPYRHIFLACDRMVFWVDQRIDGHSPPQIPKNPTAYHYDPHRSEKGLAVSALRTVLLSTRTGPRRTWRIGSPQIAHPVPGGSIYCKNTVAVNS